MDTFITFLRRPQNIVALGMAVSFALVLWLLPFFAVFLTLKFGFVTLALAAARLVCSAFEPKSVPRGFPRDDFVSIHIATYSEPPEVVIKTLDSLVGLKHEKYEVIVLDNNTDDPDLYEPVKQHCQSLGSQFRFYHFDGVKGAKAGALNISLELSDPRTDTILILDADYQALPGILKTGLSYFVDSSVGFVQFPQAYRNSHILCGLTWEYKLFFALYMKLANRWNTVLSTGTAAFVKKKALVEAGGWSGETLTEDAELGLRLHRYDYRGVYVSEIVAAGLMPTDLKSLKAQRRRWVLGNAQSLLSLFKIDRLSARRRVMMALQLTAWANPLLITSVTFLVGAAFHTLWGDDASFAVVALSFLSITLYLVATLILFLRVVTREGGPPRAALKAFGVHLGMLQEGAVSWCELFLQTDKSFVRTSKFIRPPKGWAMRLTLLFFLVFGALSFKLIWLDAAWPLALASGLVAVWALGSVVLRWTLRQVRRRTLNLKRSS